MMRIALPTWEGRISPVFDVAEHLLLVDVDGTSPCGRDLRRLGGVEPLARTQVLTASRADVLICGAISRPLERVLTAAGIAVVSGICGDVDEVVRAFCLSRLDDDPALHLPGCQRPRPAADCRVDLPRPGTPPERMATSRSNPRSHVDVVAATGPGPAAGRAARRP